MKNIWTYLAASIAVVGFVGAAHAIPIVSPPETIATVKDLTQNETIKGISDMHQEYQDASNNIMKLQTAARQLKQYTSVKDALLGRSNVLSGGMGVLGIQLNNPINALSDTTLRNMANTIAYPTSEDALQNMADQELQRLAWKQAEIAGDLAVEGIARAWMTQTEASAKSQALSEYGKEVDNAKTQSDVLLSLIRISSEITSDMNTRVIVTSGGVATGSAAVLRDIKI